MGNSQAKNNYPKSMQDKTASSSFSDKIAKGAFWSGLQSWLKHSCSLIIFIVLARKLGASDFGLVALANAFITVLQLFANGGFKQNIIQRESIENSFLSTTFWLNIFLSLTLVGFIYLLASPIEYYYKVDGLSEVLRTLSLILIINSCAIVPTALILRDLRIKQQALRHIFATIVGGIVGIALASSGFGAWSLVWQQLIYAITSSLLIWYACNWRPNFILRATYFSEIASFSTSILGMSISITITKRLPDFFIGYFYGASNLGLFSIAQKASATISDLVYECMNKIALPSFSAANNQKRDFDKIVIHAIEVSTLICLPAYIFIAVNSEFVINLVFGEKWSAASTLLTPLLLAAAFFTTTPIINSALISKGHPQSALFINLFGLGSGFILLFIGSSYGLVETIQILVIHNLLNMAVSIFTAFYKLGFNLSYWVGLSKIYFAAACAGLLSYLSQQVLKTQPSPLIFSLIYCSSYLFFSLLFCKKTILLSWKMTQKVVLKSKDKNPS